MTRRRLEARGSIPARLVAAEYLSTRDLAALLGRRSTKGALEHLRERLHALRVPFKGPRLRPRWRVERARTLLGA